MKSFVVGLTGQTGAGKTTVSDIFLKNNFGVINADHLARKVSDKGTECLLKLVKNFGNEILNCDGSLNRKYLAQIVFKDKCELKKLNNIIFPFIIKLIKQNIYELNKQGYKLIILDAPTLFESGANRLCDKIVSVVSLKKNRLNRIIYRDQLDEQNALNRINSQLSEEFFIKNSDFIIENNYSKKQLISQTLNLVKFFKENNFE